MTYKALYKGNNANMFPSVCTVKEDIFRFVVFDREGNEHRYDPDLFHQLFTIIRK